MLNPSVTIRDIAKLANVSTTTVSRVINGKGSVAGATTQKIKHLITELNFTPNALARNLVGCRSNEIGVVFPFEKSHENPLIRLLFDRLMQNQCVVIGQGVTCLASETDAIETLLTQGCDAVIVCHPTSPTNQLKQQLQHHSNLYVIDAPRLVHERQVVNFDHSKAGELQAIEVIKSQCQQGLLVFSDDKGESASQRLASVEQTLVAHNVSFDLCEVNNQGFEAAYTAIQTALSAGTLFDFVIAENDVMAFESLNALLDNNITVPTQMRVVGFGNHDVAAFCYPKITTINCPYRCIVEEIVERMTKDKIVTDTFLPTIIRRGS